MNQEYSLNIVNVVNGYSSWKRLMFMAYLHVGVLWPIPSNHHSGVPTVHCLAHRVKKLIDD